MAAYTYQLHTIDGAVLASYQADLWQGNRDQTNRQALAIGSALFSYLAYGDEEFEIAVWGGLGGAGLAWAEQQRPVYDWKESGAVTLDYLLSGRTKTACFTLKPKLGQLLVPGDDWFVSDADRSLDMTTARVTAADHARVRSFLGGGR